MEDGRQDGGTRRIDERDVWRFLGGGALCGLALSRGGLGGVGLALGGGMLIGGSGLLARARRGKAGEPIARPDEEARFGEDSRDLVEEASWESFPASDPPAYSA